MTLSYVLVIFERSFMDSMLPVLGCVEGLSGLGFRARGFESQCWEVILLRCPFGAFWGR